MEPEEAGRKEDTDPKNEIQRPPAVATEFVLLSTVKHGAEWSVDQVKSDQSPGRWDLGESTGKFLVIGAPQILSCQFTKAPVQVSSQDSVGGFLFVQILAQKAPSIRRSVENKRTKSPLRFCGKFRILVCCSTVVPFIVLSTTNCCFLQTQTTMPCLASLWIRELLPPQSVFPVVFSIHLPLVPQAICFSTRYFTVVSHCLPLFQFPISGIRPHGDFVPRSGP